MGKASPDSYGCRNARFFNIVGVFSVDTSLFFGGEELEYFTIAWNSLEGLVSIVAGMIAGSVSLIGLAWTA